MVVRGLVESDVVLGVDDESRGVDVVPLEHHLENFGLIYSPLLHKVYDLVLHHDRVVNIVVQLYLHLVFQLARLVQELLVLNWVGEIFVVLGEEVELADVRPGVEPVAEGVLGPYTDVLAAAEEEELVDLLLEVLPVEDVGEPGEGITHIEDDGGQLPGPAEGVNEEDVVGEGDEGVVHAVWVLQVNRAVLDVIAGVQEQLTVAVELESLRGLVDLVCALEVLSGTLGQLCLRCPHDFVQVLDLAETPGRLLD